MPLAAGTTLGPYEILESIGVGGMGEVYRARDPKLDRFVAIKVLPPALQGQEEFLARFEREAKAVAALSHPNILGIFDFGKEGSQTYAVMELLEGESLRQKLDSGGPLHPRKAVEFAQQAALGLAEAHDKGIIHRDIKPENLFITRDGRLKVLDFGLAKQVVPLLTSSGSAGRTTAVPLGSQGAKTEMGSMMGTVGYMSPEQVRGEGADPRSDIFALGVVLYEMLMGKAPFKKATPIQTLGAILDHEPEPMEGTRVVIPMSVERLVAHCLEKAPEHRFQSMRDLAYSLSSLSFSGSAVTEGIRPLRARWRAWRARLPLATLGVVLTLGAGLWAAGLLRLGRRPAPPAFTRLTFAPGTVESACFGPDGKTFYFSARVGGGRPEIFAIDPRSPEPKSLGVQDALVLGASRDNELLFLKHPVHRISGRYRGLLAQVAAGGGAERDLQDHVLDAAKEGRTMALATLDDDYRLRLEFPAGKVLMEASGRVRGAKLLRISPEEDRLALVEDDGESVAEVVTYTREGRRTVVLRKEGDGQGETLSGLAWGPEGRLWLSELQGDQTAVWSLSPSGRQRLLWRGPGVYQLMDVSAEGRMLLAAHQRRRGVMVQRAGDPFPTEVTLSGGTQARGLSADGRSLLLLESPSLDGGTALDQAFLRPLGGGPALRLAAGNPHTLTPDGRWVHLEVSGLDPAHLDGALVTALQSAGAQPGANRFLLFVPTGVGRPWALALPEDFTDLGYAYLLPGEEKVVFNGAEKEKGGAWFLADRKGGRPRPIVPYGMDAMLAGCYPVSPDGQRMVVTSDLKSWYLISTRGGARTPVQGIQPGERPVGWSADGHSLYLRPELSVLPVAITRLDPATGRRTPVAALAPPDPAGHLQTRTVWMTPDARTFAYSYDRKLSELYVVEGVR